MPADAAFMEKLVALCKRRGFIYQSSEIYGGIGGFWDYGPMGVELKRNIKDQWWHDMVASPPDGPDGHEIEMVGVDCSIIMNPKVWEASGHATGFVDPMVDCRNCNARIRADQLFVLTWFDMRAWRAFEAAHPDLGSPSKRIDELRKEYRQISADEIMSITRHEIRRAPPMFAKSVIASSAAEAQSRCALTQAEEKHLGDPISQGAELYDAYRKRVGQPFYPAPPCPECGAAGYLTEPRAFNLMFESHAGALQDEASKVYLRPETAQGIFANFKNVLDTTRVKVAFGIAQVGKAFRNEINPRNYTFRSREFEQMEVEFFCHPDTAMQWYDFWRKVRYDWYVKLGLKSDKLRLRDQGPEELAHYSKACADIEYLFPFSDEFQELEGVAHRGNFDLTQHQQFSGKDLTYFDDEAWERDKPTFGGNKEAEKKAKNAEPYRYLPTVIEPSAGADRSALAFLCEAYTEDQAPDEKGEPQTRVVMKFHPRLAPIKVAVFPLVNREGMPDVAYAIYRDVKKHLTAFYDEKGAIGRRYRRQDEVGTPFCVTVDGQTLQDGTVTIRDRDTLLQVRVGKDHVLTWLREKLGTT